MSSLRVEDEEDHDHEEDVGDEEDQDLEEEHEHSGGGEEENSAEEDEGSLHETMQRHLHQQQQLFQEQQQQLSASIISSAEHSSSSSIPHIQEAVQVPDLLLPVNPSNEVIDDNETIIKAAKKAGYNVKRHLDALTFAKNIVERYKQRGNVLPREWSNTHNDPVREQEYKDAGKLRKWKQALRGSYRGNVCAKEIRDYLDEHMPAWRIDRKVKFRPAMQFAQEIVERCKQRGGALPKFVKDRSDPAKIQEFKDAQKLKGLRQGLIGIRKEKCSDEVRDYLDKHIPKWRDRSITSAAQPPHGEKYAPKTVVDPLDKAKAIVARYHERGRVLPKEWSDRRGDSDREQEYKDAGKLRKWRQALKGSRNVSSICPDVVRDYLDKEMPSWRSDESRARKKQRTAEQMSPLSSGVVIGVHVGSSSMINSGSPDSQDNKRSRSEFEKEEDAMNLVAESADI